MPKLNLFRLFVYPYFDDVAIKPGWKSIVEEFRYSAPGLSLQKFLQEKISGGSVIYPPEPLRILKLIDPKAVRVIILGQDPYHGYKQADGLSFSVAQGIKFPPSLCNIFKELQRDLGKSIPLHGCLLNWVQQGVFLLNTCLTVNSGQPASHAGRGWELFTDQLIRHCSDEQGFKIFLLWGAQAQKKIKIIDTQRHAVLISNHPSPLSAHRGPMPFVGCGHFSQVNKILATQKLDPIEW